MTNHGFENHSWMFATKETLLMTLGPVCIIISEWTAGFPVLFRSGSNKRAVYYVVFYHLRSPHSLSSNPMKSFFFIKETVKIFICCHLTSYVIHLITLQNICSLYVNKKCFKFLKSFCTFHIQYVQVILVKCLPKLFPQFHNKFILKS